MTQGLLATMVADTAPKPLRGTAFGVFNLASGLALLVGSVVAGLLLGSAFAALLDDLEQRGLLADTGFSLDKLSLYLNLSGDLSQHLLQAP